MRCRGGGEGGAAIKPENITEMQRGEEGRGKTTDCSRERRDALLKANRM